MIWINGIILIGGQFNELWLIREKQNNSSMAISNNLQTRPLFYQDICTISFL